jgi:hypothetical protein
MKLRRDVKDTDMSSRGCKKERDGALQRNRIFFYNFADLITTLKTDAFGAETLCPTLSG